MEILSLWPFSQGELAGIRESFVDALFADTLPAAAFHKEPPASLQARIISGGYPEAVSRVKEDRRMA